MPPALLLPDGRITAAIFVHCYGNCINLIEMKPHQCSSKMEAGSSQSTAARLNLTDSLDETTAFYSTDDSSSSEENACHYTFARMANTVADNKHKDSALAVKRYASLHCGRNTPRLQSLGTVSSALLSMINSVGFLCQSSLKLSMRSYFFSLLCSLLAEKADLLSNPVPFVL